MVSKNLVWLLAFFCAFVGWGQDFFTQDLVNNFRPIGVIGDESVDFKIESGEVILRYNGTWSGISDKLFTLKRDDVVNGEDGYLYATLFSWDKPILYGSRFFLIMNNENEAFGHGYRNIGSYEGTVFADNSGAVSNQTLIKTIVATSFLQEGLVSYNTDQLAKYLGYFYYNPVRGTRLPMQVIVRGARHWVEGVDGPGIGEQLSITFTEPCPDIVVLNGFVDRNRKYLYKANNMVRTAIIKSADSGEYFEFEYTFDDVVQFTEIRFPRLAEKVIFEIKSVYPGDKWDDTCISAILTREPDPYTE